MNPICFYHKADLDGVCSAAIVKHFVPECELYGIDYGDEFPWDKVRPGMDAETDPLWMHLFKPENGYKCGDNWETLTGEKRTVYMVDFSLPCEDMQRLAKVSNLTWIDHHNSALKANASLQARGMRDTTRAACELAWVWMSLFPDPAKMTDSYTFEEFDVDLPEAVRLLGRYDVWDKDHPDWSTKILPFQYGMRAQEEVYDPTNAAWLNWLTDSSLDLRPIVEQGAAILRYQAEVNRKACEAGAHYHTILAPMPGQISTAPYPYRTLCCNTTTSNSQFFDGFYAPEKHDVMCAYCQRSDGKWKVSLYSDKPTIDCGEIAKSFGGGGNKGATGFVCAKLPWVKL